MHENRKNENILLNNGEKIPLIGLRTDDKNAEEIIYYSIKDGVRLIYISYDSDNNKSIGEGIQKAINNNLVLRKDLFIIGKFRLTHKDTVENIIRELLKQLNLDYLDLILSEWSTEAIHIHKNYYLMTPIDELWKEMENLIKKGLTKSIGVCNYNIQSLNNILSFCEIKPVVNAIEFHPYYFQKNMKVFCEKNDIVILALTPIAKGDNIQSYINDKKDDEILKTFHENINQNLVYKYEKTQGQILLNWHIQQGIIPIVSTSKINRMEENLEALDFNLQKKDIDELCHLGKRIKLNNSKEIYDYDIWA